MAGSNQTQTITVKYVATKAQQDAAKWAADEQKRTRETGNVAKTAAKEASDAAKKAARDSADAAKAAAKEQVAASRSVTAAARVSAKEQTAASREAAAAAKKATAATGDNAQAIHSVVAATVGLAAGRQIITSIGDEFKRSADYVRGMAKDFIELQKTMQSVAAITGNQNSNKFTLTEATAGAAANLKPEEWNAFRDAFMAKSSNYVGDKPSARLNTEEANKFQAGLAEYAKLHGVAPGEMADFGGGLLAQEKGPTDAKTMLDKAGKAFATLEASSKKVSGLLPGMTRIMAQGFTALEAAPKLAAMPEIAPEEESTHLLRAINEIRQQTLKGKGAALGIKPEMSSNEQLETAVISLRQQSDKNGEVDKVKLDKLLETFTKESISQGTLRGLVLAGPKQMEMWKEIGKKTPADVVAQDIIKGRQSDAGKVMHAEAQEALAKVERGAMFASAEPELLKGRAELVRSGKLDEYNMFEKAGRWGASFFTGVDAEQQQINQITLGNVRQRALKAGVQDPGLELASRTGNDAILTQQLEVNKEVVRLLKLIAEKEAKAAGPKPLLKAQHAAPAVRMGG